MDGEINLRIQLKSSLKLEETVDNIKLLNRVAKHTTKSSILLNST